MIELWPLLLPVAAFSGWYLGRRERRSTQETANTPHACQSRKEYLVGLNYILNEQPDKAVDVFIQLLAVDNDTVETHLALGSLFRRRGETDRAIRIHQNLIAKPQLTPDQKRDALMALGRDYMSAGFIDRAERIFEEIAQQKSPQQALSLQYLLDLYQREHAWISCITAAKKLASITGKSHHQQIAHYYCECAEMALKKNNRKEAHVHVMEALKIDKYFVRAHLLLGQWAMQQEDYKAAVKAYEIIKKQDPRYLAEIAEPLLTCYHNVGAASKKQKLYDTVKAVLHEKPIYRCEQCGYSGKHLYWLCPSCKAWSTMNIIEEKNAVY